jgi:hypothetical protein
MKRLVNWKQQTIDVVANSLRKIPLFYEIKIGRVAFDVETTDFCLISKIHIKHDNGQTELPVYRRTFWSN